MTEERRVDLVRIVSEERYYDREALLGRDTSSVFPSLSRQQQQEAEGGGLAGLSAEAIQEAIGARKFISESELETLRATRGVTADDGAVAADKPLAEILRERKAAKDAEHAEKWRLMKVGKNRPLDPEELQFLDCVAAAEAERERQWQQLEREELEAFKAALRERSAEPEAGLGSEAEPRQRPMGPAVKADPRVPSVAAVSTASLLLPKPTIKVKPKTAPLPSATQPSSAATAGTAAAGTAAKTAQPGASTASAAKSATGSNAAAAAASSSGAASSAAEEPPSKRVKVGD
ncbi:hypothetical protein Agub_g7014, partial [Astrephomene gubernaculifera]